MAVDVGSAVGYLDLDISGFLRNLKTANEEAGRESQSITNKFGNNLTSAGKNITSAGKTLTKTVTVPIVGLGAAIVKSSADFEAGMSKVSAISGATGDDLERLSAKAKEMGAKTKFSATESTEAFTYMAMAGWKTEDMLQGIEGIMSLSAADGLDLATTSDIVTDALTAFGLQASDSGHFADVLATSASNANTNVSMLGESFKYVAPVAGAMGYSVEDVSLVLGTMANSGIKASQAGTALRTTITNLAKPTDSMRAAMDSLGISLTDSSGQVKPLKVLMNDLRTSFSGLTEEQKAQYAATLAGKTGMAGLLAVVNSSEQDWNNLSEAIDNADGASKRMADTMLNNLSGQWTILKSQLEGLALQFGEILLPRIKKFVEKFQELAQKFSELSPKQKEHIVNLALIAAAIGPVLLVIGKLMTSVGKIITTCSKISGLITKLKGSFTVLQTAIGGISAPVIAVAAVVAVLVAAFVNLWKNNEEFRNKVTEIWNQIKTTFHDFVQGIVSRIQELGLKFEGVTDTIKAIWQGFCDFLAPIFEAVFQTIANVFTFVTNTILNMLDFWIALFTGNWKGAWDAIKNQFKNVWELIKNILKTALNMLKGLFNAVLGWFGTSWDECWNKIKTVFSNVWNGIKSTASNIWNSIKTTASNIWNGIKTTFSTIWDGIKTIASNVWNGLKTTFSNVWNSIKDTASNIWNGIKSTASNVWNGIKSTIQHPIESARDLVKGAIDKIKGFFDFDIKWPKIPMPHFKINPPGWQIGDLLKGKIPTLGIDWYAKAMNNPMLLTKPTIFGYNATTGQLLGGGEAGNEVVAGASTLMRMIKSAVNTAIGPFVEVAYKLTNATVELGYVSRDGFEKQKKIYEQFIESKDKDGGGDTFIFNSPKSIDEIEAAKQMKKVKKELAEGF